MNRLSKLSRLAMLGVVLLCAHPLQAAAQWPDELVRAIERIDEESPGRLGVYVKSLADGAEMLYAADRPWYLSSATKVPIALAVLEEVDDGKLSLDDELALEDVDRVDGSGDLVWQDTGATRSVDTLLEDMLVRSDNTAANLLIRTIGEDTLNRRTRNYFGRRDFEGLTTFTQVRYDIYGELHPDARKLSNEQLVEVAGASIGPERVRAFSRIASIESGELKTDSMSEAYARYYARGLNSARLDAYGGMLEKVVTGELLSDATRERLYHYMRFEDLGDYRLEGGLPRDVRFIHKTGTQHQRACHVGVVDPQDGGRRAVIVVACAEDLDEAREAGPVLRRVGEAVSETALKARPGE